MEEIMKQIEELELEQEQNEYGSLAYDCVDAELQYLYSKVKEVV